MSALAEDLAALADVDLGQLREAWRQHYRSNAPVSMSRELLMRAVGYKMQEAVLGGLDRRTLLRLSSSKLGDSNTRVTTPPPKSGTKLIREWRGKVHEVLTLEDGQFAYAGKTYRSLTTIARHITDTHQSGPKFFGLKDARMSADG
jgi:hypothetical protein